MKIKLPKFCFGAKIDNKNILSLDFCRRFRPNMVKIVAVLFLGILSFGIVLSNLGGVFNNFGKIAQASGSPTISSITPNYGSPSGGNLVTIAGTNFSDGDTQRIITITNPASTITNYEGNFTLDTASLITDGKLRGDCGDIRIKDADGNTDLNYWIDGQCNSTNTIIWFKKPSLAAGTNTVVLRYNSSSLTSQSNLANFSFGPILGGTSNKLWLSANNIATANTFRPSFINQVGVSINGGDISKNTTTGWNNSGLTSSETINSGNGFVSAKVDTGSSRMIGLSKGNSNSDYADIDFAIYPSGNNWEIYEGGVGVGSSGPYTSGDTLSVEASGNKILYKKNGAVVYVSSTTLTSNNYPLLMDTAFYDTGSLKDVQMCIGICNSSSVETLLDRSGNNNNATQDTGLSRPQLVTNYQNGKPSIRFDGVNDSMTTPYMVPGGSKEGFFVTKFNSLTGPGGSEGLTGTQAVGAYFYLGSGGTTGKLYAAYGNNTVMNGITTLQTATSYLLGLYADSNNAFLKLNTSTEAIGSNLSSNTSNLPFLIGKIAGQYNLSGDIPETLIFNTALSGQDRQVVETYLNTKYNLYGSNPSVAIAAENRSVGSVSFGGNPGTNLVFVNPTQLSVKVPASSLSGNGTGSVAVVVTNPDGSSVTLSDGYSYAAPAISSVTPNSGATTGGYNVTINGTNFTPSGYKKNVTISNVGQVLVNNNTNFYLDTASLVAAGKMKNDCGDLRIKDSDTVIDLNYWIESGCNTDKTSIWVKVPTLPSGNKDIFVTYGESNLTTESNSNNFSFGPILYGSSLKSWLAANSGTSSTTDGAAISSWQDKTTNANNFTQSTPSKNPTFTQNALNGLPVVTFAASNGQTMTNSTNFGAPYTIIYLSRQTGGANQRVLSGVNDNFLLGYWNGGRNQLYDDSAVRLTGADPASDTNWRIYSASGNNGNAKLWGNGTELASAGGNWSGPNGISLNGQQAASEFSNAQIAEILVFNSYLSDSDRNSAQDYINTKYRIYGDIPATTIGSESGSNGGTITFGGNPSASVKMISSTQFTTTVPASTLSGNKTGSVDVVITNPDGLSATLAGGFTYAAPVVTSITPNIGPNNGGTFITISGSNFTSTGTTAVTLGGQNLTNVSFVNPSALTGYVPAGSGSQNLTVTNSDGLSGTLNNAFSYGSNGVPNPIVGAVISDTTLEFVPLSWTAPFNGGSAITDYIIKYSSDDFMTETIFNEGVNSNTNVNVTGLTPGLNYKFKIIAVNSIGNSLDSNILNLNAFNCDTNLNGADFTPANGSTLSGRYCNIGTFTVSNGFTVNTAVGSRVKIYAQTANIAGTLSANSQGFLGGYQTGNSSGDGLGAGGGVGNSSGGGGGGYGGNGGRRYSTTGGLGYGSVTEPSDLGSGGSAYASSTSYPGGSGGGAIKLNVTGTLTNNGTISANGQSSTNYGGGGSGGSIWINTGTLAGTGSITTTGGSNPGGYTGGGGGGRIALYYQSKTFSGSATAASGSSGSTDAFGGAGTVYEPNQPQAGLADALFSPNPNPVSTSSTFTVQITNLKNTFGYNLFSGTCSVNITGLGGYSQSYSGTVNTGICTISGTYPAPTVSGSGYTAALSVTGSGTTETKNVNFDVTTAASNKAKLDTGNLPVYSALTISPNNPLIGTNYTITGSGFVDSANNQSLNGIPCAITIVGPNSYSNTFNTSNIIGGNCAYNFDATTLPKVPGIYTAKISLQGDSATLTTNTVNFNYYFDIYLSNGAGFDSTGKIPGTITSSQSTIVLNDPNPIFTSPVIKKYDNSSLIPVGTPCAILVTIGGATETPYTSSIDANGQCVVNVPNTSFTAGSLSIRNRVTLQNTDFYTSPNTAILIQNFPSNKAKADATTATAPKLTSQTSSPTPTFIGLDYTLSVTGLEDSSIVARPLSGLNCSIIVTGPNGYSDTQNIAVTAGVCAKTYSGNTPQTPGQYSFKMQVAGDSGTTLETQTLNFNRYFNLKLSGGTAGISGSIGGSTSSTSNQILLNTGTVLTSPVIRNFAETGNISGLTCRNVLKINSGSDQFYNSTLNGSGQCVTNVPSGDIPALGTAYVKTQISAINSDYNPAYTFENSNTVTQIRNVPTAKICVSDTFRDDNKNGVKDGSEPLLSGVITRLKDASNTTVLYTLTTTGSGPNCFNNLFDDTYYVQQVLPTGGILQTSSQSYQVVLGVGATENRSFGYSGDAVICPTQSFIDINSNGVYENGNGDYLMPGLVTDLYLSSDLNNSLQQITTNSAGTNCFTALNPGSYAIVQSAPVDTTSTTGTIIGGKVTQNVTLVFGTNLNQKFGYTITPSQKAKPQNNPNQIKPVYTSISELTSINTNYNEKAFVNYPASASVTGLIDSNTNLPLNSTGTCSSTFSGPSFPSPITVSALNVVSGVCTVDNTNNASVIPQNVAAGNSVTFTVSGPNGDLSSDSHSFEVFSGNSTICPIVFADYNLDGIRDSNEPYLSGIETKLYTNNGADLQQTIQSNSLGTSCFSARASGINYSFTQTAPNGTSLTTGNMTRTSSPFPETTVNQYYGYKGSSTITPLAFRDDDRNGVNNSENALNGIFSASLKDFAGNTIASNLNLNGINQFTNLLPTTVLGGNYIVQVNTNSLLTTNTTNNNPATITNLSGGSNQNQSFGFASDASICPNPTFGDYNGNGSKDGSESNLDGLQTRLLKASDGSEIATLSTNGTNCFNAIIPNDYILEQTHPTGAVLTTTPGTQNSGKTTVSVTNVFGVSSAQAFGYKGNATICPSSTFQDLNKNGIKDQGELEISGLTTVLKDQNGAVVQTITTNGSNCFTNLLPGNYQIVQTPPNNSTSTTAGTTVNVSVASGETKNQAFGYNGEPLICPVVYRDDNSNTTKDAGETSLENSVLTLKNSGGTQVGNTILSNGTVQCFEPVTIGQNFTVTATTPSGYTATTALTSDVAANFGQKYTPSFGFNGNATVCITKSYYDTNSNGVFDTGESPIAGLTSKIQINGFNSDLQIVTTDSNGSACFNSLPPGQYKAIQIIAAGTGSTTGGDQVFSLTAGQNKDLTFGYSGSGAICVNLYNDTNFNGKKDASEGFIENVTAQLYLQSNLQTPIASIVTNSTSNVCFTALQAGNYQVKIVTAGYLQDNNFTSTTGGNTQNLALIGDNSYYSTPLLGFTNDPNELKGALNGLIFVDRQENGIMDPRGKDGSEITVYDNDVPIVEQQVNLLKDIGGGDFALQSTQITTGTGEFSFIGLDPGVYKVQIVNGDGVIALATDPAERILTVTTNQKRYDLYGFQYTAKICPSIYVDKNNNGVFDIGDTDLIQSGNINVQLEYQSFDGTQIYGGGSPNGITLNAANPCITKVPPRNYSLKIASSNNLTSLFDANYFNQRNPVTNPTTTIYLGNTTTPSIRYYSNAVTTLSSIYGKVWNDRPVTAPTIDLNGSDDKTGTENVLGKTYDRNYDNDFGYPNLNLSLRKCGSVPGETQLEVDAWNAAMPTTTTDSNGDYTFTNIPTGAYAVVVNTPVPNLAQTTTYGIGTGCNLYNNAYNIFFNSVYADGSIGVAPGSNQKYDVIYYFTPSVDVKLWIDTNQNGTRDAWEDQYYWNPYLANADLQNNSGVVNMDQLKYFKNGVNNFSPSVVPDTYDLKLLNTPGNSNIPNDYNIINSDTQTINTTTGSVTAQFGINPTKNSSLSGKVFLDRNNNNIYEPDGQDGNASTTFDNDIKYPDKTVNLYYGYNQNQFKVSTTSDSEGNYQFSGLAEGLYTVVVGDAAPSGAGCVDCAVTIGLNKDTNYAQNLRYNYNGRVRLMSFYDTIPNLTRDDEFEIDVAQGTFTLIAPDGTQVGAPVNPVLKDFDLYWNTHYQYQNLSPGVYTLQFNDLPSTLRGYSNPLTFTVSPSQTQQLDYPLTALTNNTIHGDVFVDKQQGLNQGFNNLFDQNGGDGNAAILFDNDEPLTNTQVTIQGPLGNYTLNTGAGQSYSFANIPSGKYKLYKLTSGGGTAVPNLVLDSANTSLSSLAVNYWNQISWVQNATNDSRNFTYQYTNQISTYCYDDKDLNGQISYYPDSDTTDRRLASCNFEIETSSGEKIPLDSITYYTSDPNGQFSYKLYYKANLPSGAFILRNTDSQATTTVTNFTRYEPSTLNYGLTREVSTNFATGSSYQTSRFNLFLSLRSINTNNASIIGQVFIDRNNDQIFQPAGQDGNPATLEDNDVPLNGVLLNLNQNPAALNRSTRSDQNGNYQITDLPSGIFKILVDLVQK